MRLAFVSDFESYFQPEKHRLDSSTPGLVIDKETVLEMICEEKQPDPSITQSNGIVKWQTHQIPLDGEPHDSS